MKITHYVLLFPLIALISCGDGDKLLNNGQNKARSQSNNVRVKTLLKELFNTKFSRTKTLVFEGYIGQIPSTINFSTGRMPIQIFERRNQTIGNYINVNLKIGTRVNQVEALPENYSQEDLHVYADDQTQLGVGDKVRITATNYYSDKKFYSIDGIKIEAVGAEENFDIFNSATALTSEIIRDTSTHEVYGFMDGTLSIPTVFYTKNNFLNLKFTTKTNKDFDKIAFKIGVGPSTMNSLPSSYTSKDLKIRDANGNEIKTGENVRVYGTWKRYKNHSSSGLGGQFKMEEVIVL